MPSVVGSSEALLVAQIKYDNIRTASQNAVWAYLKASFANSPTDALNTSNVLMREPEKLGEGVGFPYIIVPLPEVADKRLTMTMHYPVITFDIRIWYKDTKTSVIVDKVASVLSKQTEFFEGKLLLDQFLNTGGGTTTVDLPGNTRVQQSTVTVQYQWFGPAF